MQFNIEVITVSKGQQPSKSGKTMDYLEVAFKKDGKVEGKKLFTAFNKEVCNSLQTAQLGQTFTITAEKEGDFWQWKAATQSSSGSASGSSSASQSHFSSGTAKESPVKGQWETREERALRQVMIVKQSSLANAIATLKTDKAAANADEVLALAQRYTDWVLGLEEDTGLAGITQMEDDFPL